LFVVDFAVVDFVDIVVVVVVVSLNVWFLFLSFLHVI